MKRLLKKSASLVVVVIIVMALWQMLSIKVNDTTVMPGPVFIWEESFPSLAYFNGSNTPDRTQALAVIMSHLIPTLLRALIGLVFGITLGFLYGLYSHYYAAVRISSIVVLKILRNIPLLALIPLFLHWFGGHEFGNYVYIVFAVFIVVSTNTYDAVLNVPVTLINLGRTLSMRKPQIYKSIIFPYIIPEMIGSLRNVFGLIWAFVLAAEYISAQSGLGYMINRSYLHTNMGQLVFFMLLFMLLGMSTYLLFNRYTKSLTTWATTE